jgi:hypothetical protein
LRERGRVRSTVLKTTGPPIHVHITNAPLGSSGGNVPTTPSQPSRGIKRQLSSASKSSADSEEESLPLADVVAHLDPKYLWLNLPQYLHVLKDKGIFYAESVGSFEKEYYVRLGMAEGAVGLFLTGVKKALKSHKKKKKCAKYLDKENEYNRGESAEI